MPGKRFEGDHVPQVDGRESAEMPPTSTGTPRPAASAADAHEPEPPPQKQREANGLGLTEGGQEQPGKTKKEGFEDSATEKTKSCDLRTSA
ncbi:MAG: hypothetical protein GY696_16090 [Gammaproteobacteria bacterium]|nr:hypothetical protein [Gammaproteobacteria bacterium]